jgi:hypothetical protein
MNVGLVLSGYGGKGRNSRCFEQTRNAITAALSAQWGIHIFQQTRDVVSE